MKGQAMKSKPLILLVALYLPAFLAAQTLPPASSVLEDYVQAVGGRAALEKVQNRVVHATITVPAQGLSMTSLTYTDDSGRSYTRIESPLFGKIESGVNGETVWSVHPMAGARLLTGAEAKLQASISRLDQLADWKTGFDAVETVGTETVEGAPCYRVVAQIEGVPNQVFYFDQASKLLVKMGLTAETPQGPVTVDSFIGDYRDVDGVKLPFRTRTVQLGQEILSVTDSVKQNGEIPDTVFAVPAAIQALMKPSATE